MSAAEKVAKPRYREYETIYVMRSNVTTEAAAKVAKRVEDVVDREGGKLTLVENWGRRLLAYAVKGSTRGVYVYVKYAGFGRIVSELERNFRMLDEVIKFQTVLAAEQVDVAALEIDPEVVKFDEVQPPDPDDVEPTLAQTLGLEIVERPRPVVAPHEPERSAEASEGAAAAAPVAKAPPAAPAAEEGTAESDQTPAAEKEEEAGQ